MTEEIKNADERWTAEIGFVDFIAVLIKHRKWLTAVLAGTLLIIRFHKRTEQLAEQTARDDTVIQLAGGIAHELNQPLTIIISTAELLARRDPAKDDLQPYLEQLIQASERVSDTVQKLERATSYRTKPYVAGVRIVDLDQASAGERVHP